jgi:hypothetical protein
MKSLGVASDWLDTRTAADISEIRNGSIISAWQMSEAQGSGVCQAILFSKPIGFGHFDGPCIRGIRNPLPPSAHGQSI